MSDYQQILKAIALGLQNGDLDAKSLTLLNRILDGIPYYTHLDAIKAAFGLEDDDA